MSISSELKHILGIVMGIFIPGTSKTTTNLAHAVEQQLADIFGSAAVNMATSLLTVAPATMSGRDKLFSIADALVTTAVQRGFKGDVATLKTAALKVALTAYEAAEPNFGSDIQALAMHLSTNPIVGTVAQLVGGVVQSVADQHPIQMGGMAVANETAANTTSQAA